MRCIYSIDLEGFRVGQKRAEVVLNVHSNVESLNALDCNQSVDLDMDLMSLVFDNSVLELLSGGCTGGKDAPLG